ncbi:hypothetical protein C4553_02410 [Candidatus Parcubacteria bacterium]|nr:MAG: hypothetical protein C4553_02410 [Candidatus Parcubacteria bacterium]
MILQLKNNRLLTFYLLWAITVFIFSFGDGLNAEDVTHVLILIIFGLSFIFFRRWFNSKSSYPKTLFVLLGLVLAALVEGTYMISKPLHPSLLVTVGMPVGEIVKNYAIDVMLTTPAYILIFLTILFFIRRFRYGAWGYTFVMALGQALGDGSGFLLANPGSLLFLPYIMINYHAMNLMPFLLFNNDIKRESERGDSKLKYILPIIALPLVYIVSGAFIFTIGSFFGLLE